LNVRAIFGRPDNFAVGEFVKGGVRMLRKTYAKSRATCRVTFNLPKEVGAKDVALCGDFNGWDTSAHPMKQRKDGRFSLTISLKPGIYRYRYLLDKERWENDWAADDYVPNTYGSEDSLVII
jgi:1,4-alpha-glucan branching enzyme